MEEFPVQWEESLLQTGSLTIPDVQEEEMGWDD